MGYKPKQLGHVNIFVRNAEKAKDWYEDLLGLHTYGFTPGRAAFMSADLGNSHDIALTEVGDDADGPRKGQVGLNHMAWYMESLDDLRDLYFRIKEKKITIERVSDHGHAIGIYIRDPDGNGIELFCNNQDNPEEGLEVMRSLERENKELVFAHVNSF